MRSIIYKAKGQTIEYMFNHLKILNVFQIRDYLTCIFIYKFHKRLLPDIFTSFFVFNHAVHSVQTRQRDELHPPRFRSHLSKSFIRYYGVILWNQIRKKVSINTTITTFKKNVRSFVTQRN